MTDAIAYPLELDRAAIEAVLPHRGEILCIHAVTVLAHDHFLGVARWTRDLPVLAGHFPGMPVVPGVLLAEAAAQVAGAGMMVGDPHARAARSTHVGMLAGIRRCSFRRPVRPDEDLRIEARARRINDTTVTVSATLSLAEAEAASVELILANAPRDDLAAALARD